MFSNGCWNIYGLNVSNLDDVTKICSKYDIMCFLETMSKESPGYIPGFTTPFVVSAKKQRKDEEALVVFWYTQNHVCDNMSKC